MTLATCPRCNMTQVPTKNGRLARHGNVTTGECAASRYALKPMTKAQARRYFGTCAECGDPAEYGEVDNVKLCLACAGHHGLD